VVHELVHQWFGDLLTMKAWSDIWLNESFATYLEARGTAAWRASQQDGREADVLALELWHNKQAYLDEDGGRYRRPLVTNRYTDAYELFDRVAYEKGSLILHHLCGLLGEERFRAALTLYTKRHAHDLVETADWRQAIEDATGEPMDWFFEQWVYRAGHPQLKVGWRHDPARAQVIIEVEQTQALTDALLCYRLPTTVAMLVNGSVIFTPVTLTRVQDSLVLSATVAPTWVVLDPAGELPAVWEEAGSAESFIAQLGDAQLPANARARAAVVLAKRHPTAVIITGLSAALAQGQPELVRSEAINALGALRTPVARDRLLMAWKTTPEPRLRRAIAKALGDMRHDQQTAQRLEALLADEPSLLTMGELLAARGACEYPGATPLLRAWLKRDSWNQRLRSATLRGMAASGEAPAIDDVLAMLLDDSQCDAVISAAAQAAAQLGARHLLARDRIRFALERRSDHPSLMVRAATVKALGILGDPRARQVLSTRLEREPFGNISRIIRESMQQLDKAAAITTATAEMTKRIDTLEQAKDRLERRLESLEKRLDAQ
jgi:aminopeptidase N